MPWEISFSRDDSQPLGEVTAICERLAAAIPAIQFHREPSGLEKIEAARQAGIEYPDVIKANFAKQPAKLSAYYEVEELAILIYGFEAEPLLQLHAEVRGQGNPNDSLQAICVKNDWKVVDDASGETIQLSGVPAPGWEAFTEFRDREHE